MTDKRKKILIIMTSLQGGGAEKVLITMLKHFDYTRYDVELCLIARGGVYLDEIPPEVKLTCVYDNTCSLNARLSYNSYSKLGIKTLERHDIRAKISKHYDTIISFCEGRSLKFHSYVADRADKNITWVHLDLKTLHYTIGPSFRPRHEEEAYAMMDEIAFVSNAALTRFKELYSGNSVSKRVVYNPIDVDFISKFKQDHNHSTPNKIVVVGRLTAQKALDRVVRLAVRLKAEGINADIDIIGDGEQKEALNSLIKENGVGNFVKLRGFINPPYAEMAKASIFLSTSITEGLPLVHLEAMALGLPVVATRCTGSEELLADGRGLLTEHDDESIYQGVKRMMADQKLREECRARAWEYVQSFSPGNIMKQVYELL